MSDFDDFLTTERYFHGPLAQKRIGEILDHCSHEEKRFLEDIYQSHENLLWQLNRLKLQQIDAKYEENIRLRSQAATYMTPERERIVVAIARGHSEWAENRRAAKTLKVLKRWGRRFDPSFYADINRRDPEEVKRRIREILSGNLNKESSRASSTE